MKAIVWKWSTLHFTHILENDDRIKSVQYCQVFIYSTCVGFYDSRLVTIHSTVLHDNKAFSGSNHWGHIFFFTFQGRRNHKINKLINFLFKRPYNDQMLKLVSQIPSVKSEHGCRGDQGGNWDAISRKKNNNVADIMQIFFFFFFKSSPAESGKHRCRQT